MDNKLIETVMERLGTQIGIVDKQTKENEDLVLVLNSMVEMGKQLREKKALDTAIEKRRKELEELEGRVEKGIKYEQEQISMIDAKITTQKRQLTDARVDCKNGIKDAESLKNKALANYALETEDKIKEYKALEKDAFARMQKAGSECAEIENKRRVMKEELLAKL